MQALDLYRAIQAAAAAAPTADQMDADIGARCWAKSQGPSLSARALDYWATTETTCGADWVRDTAHDETMGELYELAAPLVASKHATFKHASGRVKLVNTRERLQGFAADMLKGAAWALWGGGPKPAETVKPRKARAATWRPGLVKVAAEALQDGQAADFLQVAIDQLGGRAYMFKAGEAFILYAPDYAEGLPEGFAVARRCDGKWRTTHMPSGLGVGYAFNSKAQALESGRSALRDSTPEKLARALEGARQVTEAQHAEALSDWRAAHGLAPVLPETEAQGEELAALPAAADEEPMSEDMAAIVATAAAVAIGTAQAQAAETCAPGAADPRAYVAAAAVDLERLSSQFNYCSTRRRQIEAGRRGELAALAYIAEALQRIAQQPGHSVDATEARKSLQRLAAEVAADAQAMSDQAHQQCGETQAQTVRTRAQLLQILASLGQAEEQQAQCEELAAELVTCDGPELDDTATAAADTPQASRDAIGADHTPTEADPADYSDPLKTRAQAGGYTAPRETLRADYLRAAEAGHTQQAGSKRGAWSAAMFRTADGRAGLAFKRPGHPVELADHASGPERMRALQAMAQAAEQAHQQQTEQAGGATAADYTQAPETLGPNCTTPHKTPAGAGALSIRLERWEGLVDECGQPETVGSFAEADAVLLRWSETAPEHGGYNKCGFVITWPDGDTYTGRFDLMHHRRERPSLRDHISGQAEFWLGTGCPMHMGEDEYRQAIERATDETRAQWSAVLGLLRLHAAYFPRQQPISCPNLRALAEHLKIEPAELVGLGVTTYQPSERNLKRGAITQAETMEGRWSGAPQLLAVVTYEDGTREHIEADAFKDHNNSRHTRRRLNLQRHGAPYLAQLAAAAAAQKAAASSAAERKEQAEKKARADLLEQFAHLERGGGCVVAARNMRALLKAAYPSVKFSVKTQQYSGGNSISVTWTDGPTDDAVGAIVNRFKHGSFNGMDDSYDFNRDPFPELFGGCYYTHVGRDESPELIERALVQHFPNAETRPSVQDWQNSRGIFDWRNVYTSQEADAYRAEFRRTLSSTDATPPAKTTRKGAKA